MEELIVGTMIMVKSLKLLIKLP